MSLNGVKTQLATNLAAISGIVGVQEAASDLEPLVTELPTIVIYNPDIEIGAYDAEVSGAAIEFKYHFRLKFLFSTYSTTIEYDKTLEPWAFNILQALYGHVRLSGNAFYSQHDGQFPLTHITDYRGSQYIGFEIPWLVRAASKIVVDD